MSVRYQIEAACAWVGASARVTMLVDAPDMYHAAQRGARAMSDVRYLVTRCAEGPTRTPPTETLTITVVHA